MPHRTGTWEQVVKDGFAKIDQDYRFLVDCLKEVLEEIGQKELTCLLPGHLRRGRGGPLPERGAQAISIAFQLLNLVEENAAQQAVRARESSMGESHRSGLWAHYLRELRAAGVPAADVLARIARQSIEPVLTGHPTEAKRWTVLDLHRELYVLLVQLENSMYTESERVRIRDKIKAVLEHLWRTGEILMTKPDVRTERLNALYYFRERFPEVLERLDDRFRSAWEQSGYAAERPAGVLDYPRLRFGSWVGGDRDGHPLVTAEVTRETLEELHHNALLVLDRRMESVQKRLGLSVLGQEVPAALSAHLQKLRRACGQSAEDRLAQSEEEPWRQLILLMRARLPLPGNSGVESPYRSPSEALADLNVLADSLHQVGAARIVREDVLPLQRLLHVFGFHLAALDVRQNSGFHDKAVAQLMDAAGLDGARFLSGTEEERLAFLEAELRSLRPFTRPEMPLGPEARATVDCLAVLRGHITRHGRAGIGSLIVSMTRSLSDLLAVYLICREAGLLVPTPAGPACLLQVVPLFETIDDLERSPAIVREFLTHPVTRATLRLSDPAIDERVSDPLFLQEYAPDPAWQPVQQIMLGYSDSNKDSGILASQWALQCAQETLIHVGDKAGVGVRFFHGRGGTVSRGAGPTHRFLEALPEGSLPAGLRVTEQGETVAQKFTNFRTAAYNLELLMAGATGVSLLHLNRRPAPALGRAMGELAAASREVYQALLGDPDFVTFYRQATPIDVLEMSRIGSRPARRTGQTTLADLRAIPWVFSWTQARFYFPGWYGVGSALARLRTGDPDLYAHVCDNYAKWPFLRYVLFNVESGLASANRKWMQAYGALVEDPAMRRRLLGRILREYDLTQAELNALLGGELGKRRPRFFKTLQAREAGLDKLHTEQLRLLREWRASGTARARADIVPALLLTVNAIASGLRTTG